MNVVSRCSPPVCKEPRALRPPKVRAANFEDYAQIASLGERYSVPAEPYEEWKSLWVGNPAYSPEMAIGWVLEQGDAIVGWLGNIQLHYELNGERLQTASPRSWVVDERYRSYALLLADAFQHQPGIDLIISTSGNERGGPAFAAVCGNPVPQVIPPEAAFWITHYTGFAASFLRKKSIPANRVLRFGLAAGLRFSDLALRRRHRTDVRYTVERRDRFDPVFDDFWQGLRKERAGTLIGRRDAIALQWHFGPALRANAAWLFTCSQQGRMIAYAVFLRVDTCALGLRRVLLADYQTLDNGDSLPPLLAAAANRAASAHVALLDIAGSSLVTSPVVLSLAPHMRTAPLASAYLYQCSDHLKPELNAASVWDLTPFDGDSTLSAVITDFHSHGRSHVYACH